MKLLTNRKTIHIDPVSIFCLFTTFFVSLNLATLSWNPLPWLDEVWFNDTAVNCALDGKWVTTAQISFAGETPIALYPPMYQWLLTGWIWLCGFSLFTARAFNILIVCACSVFVFKGMRELGYLKKWFSVLVFVFLFWGTGLFAWSYRNGRPDMVNLLCALLFLYSYLRYVTKGSSIRWIFIASILVILSGLQSCPFIVTVLAYLYIVKREYRNKTGSAFLVTASGFMAGIGLLWLHFNYHGHPYSFFWQFSQSATISNLLNKIPVLSDYIVPAQEEKLYFLDKLYDSFLKNKNHLILSIFNTGTLCFLLFRKQTNRETTEALLLGFSLLMPLVLLLSGHYLSPYSWMAYIPAALFAVVCMEKYNHWPLRCVYGILTIVFTVVLGLPRMLIQNNKSTYEQIEQFVERQKFEKDVVILSPYSMYYPIRAITKNSYYAAYPHQYLPPDCEYILVDKHEKAENFDVYIENLYKKGAKIIPVDSIYTPEIILYKVIF